MKYVLTRILTLSCAVALCIPAAAQTPTALKKLLKKKDEPSELDKYVAEAHKRAASAPPKAPVLFGLHPLFGTIWRLTNARASLMTSSRLWSTKMLRRFPPE